MALDRSRALTEQGPFDVILPQGELPLVLFKSVVPLQSNGGKVQRKFCLKQLQCGKCKAT